MRESTTLIDRAKLIQGYRLKTLADHLLAIEADARCCYKRNACQYITFKRSNDPCDHILACRQFFPHKRT